MFDPPDDCWFMYFDPSGFDWYSIVTFPLLFDKCNPITYNISLENSLVYFR